MLEQFKTRFVGGAYGLAFVLLCAGPAEGQLTFSDLEIEPHKITFRVAGTLPLHEPEDSDPAIPEGPEIGNRILLVNPDQDAAQKFVIEDRSLVTALDTEWDVDHFEADLFSVGAQTGYPYGDFVEIVTNDLSAFYEVSLDQEPLTGTVTIEWFEFETVLDPQAVQSLDFYWGTAAGFVEPTSGIYLGSAQVVPEPSSGVFVLLLAWAGLARRRR